MVADIALSEEDIEFLQQAWEDYGHKRPPDRLRTVADLFNRRGR